MVASSLVASLLAGEVTGYRMYMYVRKLRFGMLQTRGIESIADSPFALYKPALREYSNM